MIYILKSRFFKVFHNYIRKSVRKKLTPAEKCGIGINGNRWNTLLLNSIKYGNTTRALTNEEKMPITPEYLTLSLIHRYIKCHLF